jgi:5-methylcytosine-specific restriction endonuclease McrA
MTNKRPYDYHWRTVTRPRILERAGRACERCHRPWPPLDVAHLVIPPGQPGHDDDANLAVLCRRCHRAYDYVEWSRKCYETRSRRKDAGRPLLGAPL